MSNILIRRRVIVTGIVQGVGFRPYVYRLAQQLNLTGSVLNNAQGVTIELQGLAASLDSFSQTLSDNPPPLARIDNINTLALATLKQENSFIIIHSESDKAAVVAVAADKCTCHECLADISNPDNRHYRYPFTNCTNCGPRYSLINALPYDRVNTSMAPFEMCDNCRHAYENPLDRRYHAQPVSCPDCGPQLTFRHMDLTAYQHSNSADDALSACAGAIKAGKILAIKGLGGFHLVCDATNQRSVELLRQRKNRPAKPLAVMVKNIEIAQTLVTGCAAEWQVLSANERPITIMRKGKLANSVICDSVAPGIDRLGIFLPYTPLHHMLLALVDRPLVMTSANLSGEPIITDSTDIAKKLCHIADNILDHDRPILNGCDDSVVQVINDRLQVLRLARGYAPLSFYSKEKIATNTLALGAQQKNALCFGFGHNLFLSPHIGDLISVAAEQYFHDTLATFARLYRFQAQQLVHDAHPDYMTSKWAIANTNNNKVTVQHHYAHVLSTLAANNSRTQVLAFAFDGTGLGDDHSLWGGEVFIADPINYRRIGHLSPFKLIGGEQAIKQPKRLLLAILLEKYSQQEIVGLAIPALQSLTPLLFNNLIKVWHKTPQSNATTSVGRLFDVVAVLLGLVDNIQYEGQAGLKIETAANSISLTAFNNIDNNFIEHSSSKAPLNEDNPPALDTKISFIVKLTSDGQWDCCDLIMQIIIAMKQAPFTLERRGQIACGFMAAISDMICEFARQYPELPVVLTGGVFQNKYLLQDCETKLKAQGHSIMQSGLVPINDGGIALGQIWHAIHRPNQT